MRASSGCRVNSERDPDAGQLVPVRILDLHGFGLGGGDVSPAGDSQPRRSYARCCARTPKLGYGDYRAPPIIQDDVADQYSFNDIVLRRFNETMKDAIDPNGIVSPGRAGVWPAAFRSMRGEMRS